MAKREQSKNELLVIQSVDLIEYYNRNVTPLNNKFKPMAINQTTGLCPFHIDTDPSLHVWKKKNIFHCFGCGFGGDVVKTHMQLRRQHHGESITIEKAVRQLAEMFGIELDEETGHIVVSPFERAKQMMLQKDTYVIPKGQMSIAEFRESNNKVKRSKLPLKVKIQNFEHLDLVASIVLGSK